MSLNRPAIYDDGMPDLTEALRQFDATEANLKRLEELWSEIVKLIPDGMVVDTSSPDAVRYADLCRTFRHIQSVMPKLDGFELTDDLRDLDAIFMNRLDAKEAGEISFEIAVERGIYQQGETLREYRFRFAAQRRGLCARPWKPPYAQWTNSWQEWHLPRTRKPRREWKARTGRL